MRAQYKRPVSTPRFEAAIKLLYKLLSFIQVSTCTTQRPRVRSDSCLQIILSKVNDEPKVPILTRYHGEQTIARHEDRPVLLHLTRVQHALTTYPDQQT